MKKLATGVEIIIKKGCVEVESPYWKEKTNKKKFNILKFSVLK